jgi:hypothetical protein
MSLFSVEEGLFSEVWVCVRYGVGLGYILITSELPILIEHVPWFVCLSAVNCQASTRCMRVDTNCVINFSFRYYYRLCLLNNFKNLILFLCREYLQGYVKWALLPKHRLAILYKRSSIDIL